MNSLDYLGVCRELDNENILECINKGLDKSLGSPETKHLLFNALKVVHNLDEKDIPSSLNEFEILMVKMLGKSAASLILKEIANECKIN